MNRNEKMLSHPISKDFEADKKADIELRALVVAENRLVCGLVFPVGYQVDNKFPHMTVLLCGKTKPVESNAVIEELYESE
jgi:hypothetical protein